MGGQEDAGEDLLDEGIGQVVDRVPEGPLRRFFVSAGFFGLVLGLLVGQVPITVAVAAVVSGKATLNAGAIETYIDVFILVAPFVAVFGALTFAVLTGLIEDVPPIGGIFVGGLLILGAAWASVSLGGVVPAEVLDGPDSGSPAGTLQYGATTLSSYLDLYGPLPLIAGAAEGIFLGYWAAVLAED